MSNELSPLNALAHKLCSVRPPSLSILIARFNSAEDFKAFVALVRELLPEREQEILCRPNPAEQVSAFVDRFAERYFPLDESISDMLYEDDIEEAYCYLLRGIPVQVMGISEDDYHSMPQSYRLGYQLIAYLLEDPYEDRGGARVALAEACREHVPVHLLERVPEGGLSFNVAHELLNGTEYEALAQYGDILAKATENEFLNIDYDWLCECEPPPWSREDVEYLTEQWQQAEVINNSVHRLVEWIEEDPPAHFEEILNFLEGKRNEPDPRQGRLALEFAGGS